MDKFTSVEQAVAKLQPQFPLHCFQPKKIADQANLFLNYFKGLTFYAVKCNPSEYILKKLYESGITHFDVASINEIRLIKRLFPKAICAFMNPIKSQESINEAFYTHNVTSFSYDCEAELNKIKLVLGSDISKINLIVRISAHNENASLELSSKFGTTIHEAARLLELTKPICNKVGISFHVGSQNIDPYSWVEAIKACKAVSDLANVNLDILDVGGGFPAYYPGFNLKPLTEYFSIINQTIKNLDFGKQCEIWSEPGRALANVAEDLVVRVELRKDNVLHINDGYFGALFETSQMKWSNSVILIKDIAKTTTYKDFKFYGPTCDTTDVAPGPFLLPDSVSERDYIIINNLGAYSTAAMTTFNGFSDHYFVEIIS